jgi:hypothetical protein
MGYARNRCPPVTQGEVCFREPARWSFRFTSSDPDPLTRHPGVTVPQAGTGHSGFAGVGSTRSLFALDRSGFDVSMRLADHRSISVKT